MIDPVHVTGVILTGGRSTRMGRDKAFAPLEGKPLILHVVEGMSKIFGRRVLLSANDPDRYAEFGLPVVTDREREWGALAGIHAALLAAETEWVFALAVDMPLVDPAVVRAVLDRAGPAHAAVIPHGLGYHQPFHAAYGPGARTILKEYEGKPCHIHAFANRPEVLHLSEEEIRTVTPDARCFLNANTPEELDAIREILNSARRDRGSAKTGRMEG